MRGARGDYEVKNPIFELNCLAAHTVNRQPPAEETPYVEPKTPIPFFHVSVVSRGALRGRRGRLEVR